MLFMCANGEELGATHNENGIGETSRKDKSWGGNDDPEATTCSALTVASLHCQRTQRSAEAINASLYGSMAPLLILSPVAVSQI
jgi:hypothetical protein